MKNNHFRMKTIMTYDNYIVRDHRVHNVRIMPGVTFLDMICRIMKKKHFVMDQLELRNVLFKEAISTGESFDRKVILSFNETNDKWTISGTSLKVKNGNELDEKYDDNFQCDLYISENKVNKNIDIDYLKGCALEINDLDELYSIAREFEIKHYEFMKGRGKIFKGYDYVLAEIHLSELAEKNKKNFFIHPAFLDSSTLIPFVLYDQNIEDRKPYIPLHIGSFHIKDVPVSTCYVYVKKNRDNSQAKDIIYTDIELYNENGILFALFSRLAAKKIRFKELITKTDKPAVNMETQFQKNEINYPPLAKENKTGLYDDDLKQTVISDLVEMVADLMSWDKNRIKPDAGFYDLGLDSKNLLQLVQRLEKRLEEQLYPTLLFEYTNINDFSDYLIAEFGGIRARETGKEPVEGHEEEKLLYFYTEWQDAGFESRKQNLKFNGTAAIICDREMNSFIQNYSDSQEESPEKFIFVNPGGNFKRINDTEFEIDIRNKSSYEQLIEAFIVNKIMPDKFIHMTSMGTVSANEIDLDEIQDRGIFSMFFLSQSLMRKKIDHDIMILYVHPDESNDSYPLFAAVRGFLQTLHIEKPRLRCKTIAISGTSPVIDKMQMNNLLLETIEDKNDEVEIKYIGSKRQVKRILNIDDRFDKQPSNFLKDNGVYIISGGAGKLGLLFADHIAGKINAKIILTGIMPSDSEIEKTINRFHDSGSYATYIQCDVSIRENVESLVSGTRSEFGNINGIIHCAGIIKDALILNKTIDEMKSVIDPKVLGTINLFESTEQDDLDFFIMFSSLSAVTGNVGQADYSYANSFMDHFAEVKRKTEKRKTIISSINWPLWEQGGMIVENYSKDWMKNLLGVDTLKNIEGVNAFERIIGIDLPHVLLLKGDKDKIFNAFNIGKSSALNDLSIHEKTRNKTPESRDTAIIDHTACKYKNQDEEGIAIIGVSGRYPLAKNIGEFWDNLKSGRDCITEIPRDRWDNGLFFDQNKEKPGKTYSKWGGFIEDVDKFDALFFNISPREAELMDPQERIFLETIWETVEDAGYTKKDLKNLNVGVFSGVMWGQYQLFGIQNPDEITTPFSFYASVANRVSYYFNFTGPSISIDTMCSSSLTTIQLACESILRGDSDLAIAGGVNITIHPSKYILLSQMGFLSSNGRCASFGEGGDGYVPGEGVGAVLLKPLDRAIRDKDNIYAVIKGISINHGGRTSGYSVPNPGAQTELIMKTFNNAKISPDSIGYVEAHGTGTSLGDPIEIAGLAKAFRKYTQKKGFCSIGSVKSNIGHLESSAGIAGLTKVLLQMKYKCLVPSLHSVHLNPNIDFENSPFVVQQKLEKWNAVKIIGDNGRIEEYPLRATVSAFGAGGSNAFLIVENFEYPKNQVIREKEQIIVFSARNKDTLIAYIKKVLSFLEKNRKRSQEDKNIKDDPLSKLQMDFISMVSEILCVNKNVITLDEPLGDYGFDLIKFTGMITSIHNKYNLRISPALFTKILTLRILSRHVYDQYGTSIIKFLEPEAERHLEEDINYIYTLNNISYTLQVGREAMDVRFAVIVRTRNELIEQLTEYLNDQNIGNDNKKFFTGDLTGNGKTSALKSFISGNLGRQIIDMVVNNNDLEKIAKLWVEGIEIPWELLHNKETVHRISLPPYPFERKRHWIVKKEPMEEKKHSAAALPFQAAGAEKKPDDAGIRKTIDMKTDSAVEIQAFIKEIVKSLLYIDENELDLQKDLRLYGLDSLSQIRIINEIRKKFGDKISKDDAVNLFTIKAIADYVSKTVNAGNRINFQISNDVLKNKSVASEDTLSETKTGFATSAKATYLQFKPYRDLGLSTKNIFLNGVTGLLGSRLVLDFLEMTDSNIYCLVRADDKEKARERIRKIIDVYKPGVDLLKKFEDRVFTVIGDITHPNFGLDKNKYIELADATDIVIHNAAKISLHGLYEQLRAVNIDGTKNTMEFALKTRQKYFVFISSYTVMGDMQYKDGKPFMETDFELGQKFDNLGYPRTKYEAEKIIRSLPAGEGLKWMIIRPGNIMGESKNGYYPFGATGITGAFYDLFKTAIETKFAINSNQYFDITPVDYVSKGIVYLSAVYKNIYDTYHMVNPDHKTINDIIKLLREYGYPITQFDAQEYFKSIRNIGNSNSDNYHSIITELIQFNPALMPSVNYGTFPDSGYTKRVLENGNILCPKIDMDLIKTYVDYCIEVGYLPGINK